MGKSHIVGDAAGALLDPFYLAPGRLGISPDEGFSQISSIYPFGACLIV